MKDTFKDKELLEYCCLQFQHSNFTGNDIRRIWKFDNNQIHMQLYRLYMNHPDKIGKFVYDKQIYYYMKNDYINEILNKI